MTFTTTPTTIVDMSITAQKTAGTALAANFAIAKDIKLPTTIVDDGDTIGTATTKITQKQANTIHRIQAHLNN